MLIQFSKYQGTGNDFILLDNRDRRYDHLNQKQISFMCDRRFGIGADGLIRLSAHSELDFYMDYFNADGSQSFCGNGARCTLAFAVKCGINKQRLRFEAIDGIHEAEMYLDQVILYMNDVTEIKKQGADYELNTGSPHYIRFVENALQTKVVHDGRQIRYNPTYQEEGINVNFVEKYQSNVIEVCTYERGVEDETLSCGTGVTAAAIATAFDLNLTGQQEIEIHTKGGHLKVSFNLQHGQASLVRLIGPATHVFDGEIKL